MLLEFGAFRSMIAGRETRLSRWLWWFPISAWISFIALGLLIAYDSESLLVIAGVWLGGAICGAGNLWTLVAAIRRRNDWLLLLCFFALLPGIVLFVLPFRMG